MCIHVDSRRITCCDLPNQDFRAQAPHSRGYTGDSDGQAYESQLEPPGGAVSIGQVRESRLEKISPAPMRCSPTDP